MKKPIIAIISLSLVGSMITIKGQNAIGSAGGNITGAGGTVSYTSGQVVYTTNTGSTGTVSQGVQQPYEISVVTGLEEAKDIDLTFSAYPNPAGDHLTLKIENYQSDNLLYKLFDARGKLLITNKISDTETTIGLNGLTPSLYLLKVIDGTREIKIFKIIKY